jgi:hypothetical protein
MRLSSRNIDVAGTSIALDRRIAYFANERLSDNISATPEGYRICRNAVIGRSGFQTYKVGEIADPEGLLGERYRPDEELQLWRDPGEVFSAATIASFEGKTFTLRHPDELLDPDTEKWHHSGHVQNVRKGPEALPTGDWPMLGDILVTDREAIDALDNGDRELSCGYTYKLAREGHRWDQRAILGNHVALVLKGRAGAEARIQDAAPEPEKETTVSFKTIFSAFARTAKPEEMEAALSDKAVIEGLVGRAVATDAPKDDKKDAAEVILIGKTSDGVQLFALKSEREAARVKAKDEEKKEEKKEEGKDDGKEEENKAAMDRRKRMHDLVDSIFSEGEKKEAEKKAEDDADISELRKRIDEYLGEEQKEAAHKDAAHDDDDDDDDDKHGKDDDDDDKVKHASDCSCRDCKKARDSEAAKAEAEKGEEAGDDSEIVRTEPVLEHKDLPKNAFDAAMTMDLLKSFKKVVAKSGDARVKAAFDALYQGMRTALKAPAKDGGKGSYAVFRVAASTASDAAKESKDRAEGKDEFKPKESASEKLQRENDAIYADAGKKLREKSTLHSLKK